MDKSAVVSACPEGNGRQSGYLFLAGRLLFGHGHSPRALSGARVGMSSLASYGKSPSVSQPAIGTDVHQSLDVHLYLLAEVTLDIPLYVKDGTNPIDLFFGQLPDPFINIYPGFAEDLVRA